MCKLKWNNNPWSYLVFLHYCFDILHVISSDQCKLKISLVSYYVPNIQLCFCI